MKSVNIALLRGINVGGKNRLQMKELAAMFVDAGCEDVRTYIQSGNVLFRSEPALNGEVRALVSAAILSRFGYNVPIITRTSQELGDVVRDNPFVGTGADVDKLHVVFLADQPETASAESLDPDRSPGDEFMAAGREVYLHCPDGFARTKLTNSYFDSRLSTISTTRNWKTVLKLQELADATA
ncbi:MAG: DUF1697 domain-containing protein [Chloroflexota bacterium]|nr:DUF1697 domain-containing protein [Chloroflexota bacterium]